MTDIAPLLEPISEGEPSGPNLRFSADDSTFDSLKELSTKVTALDEDEEDQEPDWGAIVALCDAALRDKTKDLELITSLMEGWVRRDGLDGLGAGITLMKESCERFWPSIHPGIDPDDGEMILDIRARWLNWMDNARGYILAIKETPLLQAADGSAYSWRDYENTELLEDTTVSPERREELLETGVITLAQWQAALGATAGDTLRGYGEQLGRCASDVRALSEACRGYFSDYDEMPPDLYNLVNAIDAIQEYFEENAGEAPAEAAAELEAAPMADGAVAAPGAAVATGPIATRADALKQLQAVGDYFRRAEPHSPISLLIARAVKWGSMSLEELYKDVVRNDDVIEHIWETLGLDGRPSDDDEDD